jgi:hypothetical protein
VGCTTGGVLEGGAGTSATSTAGGDRAGIVPHGILLGRYGAGWLVSLVQFCVVSITLVVVTV